jgi:Ca-activated chloride channel family protein
MYLRSRQVREKGSAAIAFPSLPSTVPLTWRVRALRWVAPVTYAAIALLWVAMARPQRQFQEEHVKGEGIDIFLVMDLSSSMLARDFDPDRLTVSKRVAADFVSRRPYDRIGLAVFAGESYTQSPLTLDHAVVKTFLEGLECGQLEDGTAIGMGLAAAVNRLKDSQAKSKVVVLLTDGVNNSGYIQPAAATALARTFGIRVYTIGVGSYGQAMSPVQRRPDGVYLFGLTQVEIDEPLLEDIAAKTGGRYYRATSAEALEQIYAEIDKLEKTTVEVAVFRRYTDVYRFPLLFAAALLLLVGLARITFLRILPG